MPQNVKKVRFNCHLEKLDPETEIVSIDKKKEKEKDENKTKTAPDRPSYIETGRNWGKNVESSLDI